VVIKCYNNLMWDLAIIGKNKEALEMAQKAHEARLRALWVNAPKEIKSPVEIDHLEFSKIQKKDGHFEIIGKNRKIQSKFIAIFGENNQNNPTIEEIIKEIRTVPKLI